MADLPDSLPHVLTVDGVLPAELVVKAHGYINSAGIHLRTAHVTSGRKAGNHSEPVVHAATAMWRSPTTRGQPSDVQNGGGTLAFAKGFRTAPRLFVGTHPVFQQDGYFLEWEVADFDSTDPACRQIIRYTPCWTGSGNPDKLAFLARGAKGVMRLGLYSYDANGRQQIPDTIKYLQHVTLAVNVLRPFG